jgi:DNA-binding transcriptional LysR family regulator
VELSHLETFAAVYRTGNLTKAAVQLNRSQPSVSAHVKALEAEIGRPLFVRLHRGVEPTSAAHVLADEISEPIDALLRAGSRVRGGEARATLLLGGPVDAIAAIVLPALAPLVERGLRIRVMTGLTKDLAVRLGEGELDLVIATTPTRHRSVLIRKYFVERLMLVAAPTYRIEPAAVAASRGAVLEELPLVAFADPAPLVRRYWREQFARPAPRPSVVVEDLRAVLTATEAGVGWSVLPDYLAAPFIARRHLKAIHRIAEPPSNTLYIATRTGRRLSDHVSTAVDRLLAVGAPSGG